MWLQHSLSGHRKSQPPGSPLLPGSTQDRQHPLLHQDTPQPVPATEGAIHSQFILSGIQSRAAPFTPKNATQALEYTKIFAYFLHLTVLVFQQAENLKLAKV